MPLQLGDLLSQVKSRMKGLGLLQQPIDEFLRADDRQRRDVINRLVRVELRALPAWMREAINDVRRDAEQPQFEYLEQAHGACANDRDFSADCFWHAGNCKLTRPSPTYDGQLVAIRIAHVCGIKIGVVLRAQSRRSFR